MLNDSSWRKLAHKRETLCARCFFTRCSARHVEVTLADLRPCLWNDERDQSWFDWFAKNAPPEMVEAWRRSIEPERQKLFPRKVKPSFYGVTSKGAMKHSGIIPKNLRTKLRWNEHHDAAPARIIKEFGLQLPCDRELVRQLAFLRVAQPKREVTRDTGGNHEG
jgi:hypothetical protein